MASSTESQDHSRSQEAAMSRYSSCSTPPNDEENALPPLRNEHDKETDPNLVGWEGDDDPENPLNWSPLYKSWITFVLSMLALAASLGSSIIAPAEDAITEYIGASKEVTVLVISLYM